ncbi:AI-2E family transporter [Galenea microaerophila]
MASQRPYEDGFLIALIILAIFGLIWLFAPFLQALFFAAILATATYPLYQKILPKCQHNPNQTALVMSLIVVVILILPLSYLLTVASIEVGQTYGKIHAWLAAQDRSSLLHLNHQILDWLGMPGEVQTEITQQVQQNAEPILKFGQKIAIGLVHGIVGSTSSFITFVALAVFALFFFYRDGKAISHHLKVLSPLENVYDTMLMHRFSELSGTLLLSILSIALLQGLTFTLIALFLGLPALFIGLAVAVASFIPIVGSALVWLPLTFFSLANGHYTDAVILVVTGAFINGFLIDNLARPIIIQKISHIYCQGRSSSKVTEHTLLTVLSTFAGLIHFGILGLFFGPVIAAMAIAIFEVYEHKNQHLLDRS